MNVLNIVSVFLFFFTGGWNLDGKSPSIWDTLVHNHPNFIVDQSNADVGADSYHFYKEDVKAIKNAGVKS